MTHCHHHWQPLVTIPEGLDRTARMRVVFGLHLQHLDGYDRCSLCGRVSWITNSRARRRKLVSRDMTGLIERAAEFEQWAAKQREESSATG